mgnify:CR=1 FL=1
MEATTVEQFTKTMVNSLKKVPERAIKIQTIRYLMKPEQRKTAGLEAQTEALEVQQHTLIMKLNAQLDQ